MHDDPITPPRAAIAPATMVDAAHPAVVAFAQAVGMV